MIGELKNIIVVYEWKQYLVLINPQMIQAHKPLYTCQEDVYVMKGLKETKRYEKIKSEIFRSGLSPKNQDF